MSRLVTTVRDRLGAPNALRASANALIVSTAVTSVAGLGFWALAARWLPADAVGIGTALVSVLTLLANLATLGLRNGLVRFLPSAGGATRRLIGGSYLACVLAAVALSVGFLIGQPWWGGHLGFLREDAVTITLFVGATVVWVLFVLQDHVLIGLRRSYWVPVENLAYSVAKIAVLPLLTGGAMWAVLGATVLPAALAVAGVGLLALRLTRSDGAEPVTGAPISVRSLARFAAADQVAWMVWVATPQVLTLIVLNVQGPEASAYYYMANMIGYSLYLITSNIGSALIAESAHDPKHAATHARAALTHSVRLVLPLAAVGILVGPFALRLLGEDYAEHASTAMQLILLSALPQTIVGISVNTARVRREMSTVVVTYVFLAAAIWGGSWITLQWWGVPGVGATILAAQTLAALGLVLTGRTGLATGRLPAGSDGAPAARSGGAGWAAIARLSHALRQYRSRRELHRSLPPALAACGLPGSSAGRSLKNDSDTLVAAVEGQTGECVLKIATSASADQNLARHADTVTALRERDGLGCADLLPRILDRTTAGQHTVIRESLLPGRTPDTDPGPAAAAAITRLHQATARVVVVTPSLLTEWVDLPAAALCCLAGGDRYSTKVARIVDYLREGLLDASITVSWTHGDYWPGNILVSDDSSQPTVTGIVDWENGMDTGLPDADLVHWYLSTRSTDLGAAVCTELDDPGRLERYVDSVGVALPNPQLDLRTIVVLTWLWHVADTCTRATRNGPGRVWLARSVLPVLRRFGADMPSVEGGLHARHP